MDTKPKAYSYIRFSTPEQEKGDSLRRQEEEARKYAKENDLIFDETYEFKDLGISGYKGINRISGALNKFIDLVDKGEIHRGSVLIIEHLDRLSREKVTDALTMFMDLINKGIKIVTLQDKMEYDQESMSKNYTQLIISIMYMASAHDESLKKSIRLKQARAEKRRKLRNKEINIFTAKCPSWIMLSEDKSNFELIPEASKAIKLLFKKKLEGKGSYRIARELNSDPKIWKPKSSRNKTGGWRESYINKILRNKSVIGEFQPYEKKTEKTVIKGKEIEKIKRVAVGEPIKNYYPKVVDDSEFFKVQEILKQNGQMQGNGGGGGSRDKGSNLFSYVVKCGFCGSTMQYVNKGSKKWSYLICDSVRRNNIVSIADKPNESQINANISAILNKSEVPKLEARTVQKVCNAKSVRYDEFEKIFFADFEELDIQELIPNDDETTSLKKEKQNLMTENKYKVSQLESEMNNLIGYISKTNDEENQKMYDKQVTKLRVELEKLITENQILEQEVNDLVEQKIKLKKEQDSITEIYSFLESAKNEEEYINRRFQLRQEIKNMVELIKIYTLQEEFKEYEEIESGIIRHMSSKSIDRISIKFKGSRKLRVIYLKSAGEVIHQR